MDTKTMIIEQYDVKKAVYKKFCSEIEHQLRNILQAEKIACNAISSRLKDRDSLGEKIDRKRDRYTCLGDITDIAGVRITTYYIADVNRVAEIVEQEFVIDKENSIDKSVALEPDRFGYCSVHYVVEMSHERLNLREYQEYTGLKCEIQIRSVLQHAWAEIEHDLGYKSAIAIPRDIRRSFSRLAGLLEIADKEFQDIRLFLQSYQSEAAGKIERQELKNMEIDAILLNAVIESNLDIIKLNEDLANIFGGRFMKRISPESFESTIRELRWFDIGTIDELQGFITKNKDKVAMVAQEMLNVGIRPLNSLKRTIAFDYLCYAELLTANCSSEQIKQYLNENHMGSANSGRLALAHFMKQISDKLSR
ncbi:MAG: hypothetical protein NC548_44390 [Lachnospiraceae bacterium]|nr:hypothetical protein [Lachnospiraceae bacterium]MCM1233324.1 hypothetical protein [Ruminococcus flavefaciens]